MSSKKPVNREQEVRRRGRYNDSLNRPATCTVCGEVRMGKDFYFDKSKTKGRDNRCKECHKSRLKVYKKKRTPEKRALRRGIEKRIRSALGAGLLVRPGECSKCKKVCQPHAHHPTPINEITTIQQVFDIVWLCKDCHMAEHENQFVEWGRKGAATAAN